MTRLWVQDESIAFSVYLFGLYNLWICKSKWKTIGSLAKKSNSCYSVYLNITVRATQSFEIAHGITFFFVRDCIWRLNIRFQQMEIKPEMYRSYHNFKSSNISIQWEMTKYMIHLWRLVWKCSLYFWIYPALFIQLNKMDDTDWLV